MTRLERFIKRPEGVLAMQYDPPTSREARKIISWVLDNGGNARWSAGDIIVSTLNGQMRCISGNWVLLDSSGFFDVMSNELFHRSHQPCSG